MKRFLMSMLWAASLMIATAADAAVAAGRVIAIDTTKHTVTLDNGTVYTTSATTDLSRIRTDYIIQVTFTTIGGVNNVTALQIVSPAQPTGH